MLSLASLVQKWRPLQQPAELYQNRLATMSSNNPVSKPLHTANVSTKTITTRILIISDTHNRIPAAARNVEVPYRNPLPRADIILHAGDISMSGKVSEYQGIINFLAAADAELKIIIAGNHDVTLDRAYYKRWGRYRHPWRLENMDDAMETMTGEAARKAGIVYLGEGVKSFTLTSGATFTIYASPYQPEFCNWAFKYELHEDRFNESPPVANLKASNPIPSHPQIDLVMTHGPPYGRLDKTTHDEDVGCPHLLKAVSRCRPRLHCFGHIHEGWGAERVKWADEGNIPVSGPKANVNSSIENVHRYEIDRARSLEERAAYLDVSQSSEEPLEFGKETIFVNASIMNKRYGPTQAPWLVDIDLPWKESAMEDSMKIDDVLSD